MLNKVARLVLKQKLSASSLFSKSFSINLPHVPTTTAFSKRCWFGVRSFDWIRIGNRINFIVHFVHRFMSTNDVLNIVQIARAVKCKCNLRNFKTSRVTINHEIMCTIKFILFYIICSPKLFLRFASIATSILHPFALCNLFMH